MILNPAECISYENVDGINKPLVLNTTYNNILR